MNKKIVIAFLIMINILFLIGCIEEEKEDFFYDSYVGNNIQNGFSTINEAINNSVKGDSIFIYNGIYDETIIINKSINIIGESNQKTIINYNGNQNGKLAIINILADNCSIQNLNINNTYNNSNSFGIIINSSNNHIINNSISNFDRGIFINSLYDDKSINNSIKFNNILKNNYGLYIGYSNNNNISYNNISNNEDYGIYLFNSNGNNLLYNNFSKNNYGLRIKGSRKNILNYNNILLNNKGLYFCCGARENIVFKNNFLENIDWHAYDSLGNLWDNDNIGNYWDDYLEKYPNANMNNEIWDTPYNITGGNYIDNYPLINPML
jgi:parallel beta-helix repeat protein